jgi:hypothetical protein
MTLQLHRPDGQGGLEPRSVSQEDVRRQLRSPRWGASLRGGMLPRIKNPEMNPTRTGVSVATWGILLALTFGLLVVGYGTGFWG